MFFLTYLRRELRRRLRQTIVTALGLAVGVGLVLTVVAVATGVGDAQAAVLRALYGIGTDITVSTEATAPRPDSPGAEEGILTPGPTEQHKDLLGLPPGLGPLDAASVAEIARLSGVRAVAGGLSMVDTRLTIPAQKDLPTDGRPLRLPTTFTVDGVDVTQLDLGPYASIDLVSGRSFRAADADSPVAVVDSGYASANRLTAGAKITVAGTEFIVAGIVRQPSGGGAADVYLPLSRAQALARFREGDLTGKVDQIYVAATDAGAVPALRDRIAHLLPSATVTSADSLAGAVTGSLASAADLADQLGRWLAVAGLVAAFAVTALLTMASVARRVREFGTLKALGWRGRRIVGQLVGESAVTGVLGAALGVALGFGGAALVTALAPEVSATVAQNPGSTPAESVSINGGAMHHGVLDGATHTIAVSLTAPITLTAIGMAVGLAIAGGLLAGALGGWRAARLRPTTAFGRID